MLQVGKSGWQSSYVHIDISGPSQIIIRGRAGDQASHNIRILFISVIGDDSCDERK